MILSTSLQQFSEGTILLLQVLGCSLSIPMEWQGSLAFTPSEEDKPRVSVQGARWEGEGFQKTTEQSAFCSQLCDSVLEAPQGFLNCSSLSCPGMWEPSRCLQVSVPFSPMGAGSGICSYRCVPDCICGAAAEQAPAGAWWSVTTARVCL